MSQKTNLVRLFNALHDWATRDAEGVYHEASPAKATHRLVCTKWNTVPQDEDMRKRIRNRKTRPEGLALSVVAAPLDSSWRTGMRFRQKTTAEQFGALPAYRQDAPLPARQRVLMAFAALLRDPGPVKRRIRGCSSNEANQIYRSLRNAYRLHLE